DIAIGILPDDLAADVMPIGQRDHDLARAVHDVAIGQDVAVGREDDARSGALGELAAAERRGANDLGDADLYDGLADGVYDADNASRIGVESGNVLCGWHS